LNLLLHFTSLVKELEWKDRFVFPLIGMLTLEREQYQRVKTSPSFGGLIERRLLSFHLTLSRTCETTDTGLYIRVVCPFTLQLSLVLINRPRRDDKLS